MPEFIVGHRVVIKDIEDSNGIITKILDRPDASDLYYVKFDDDGEEAPFYLEDLIHEAEV